jgi:hypothetical protein
MSIIRIQIDVALWRWEATRNTISIGLLLVLLINVVITCFL